MINDMDRATRSIATPLLIGAGISVLGAVIYWLVPREPISSAALGEPGRAAPRPAHP